MGSLRQSLAVTAGAVVLLAPTGVAAIGNSTSAGPQTDPVSLVAARTATTTAKDKTAAWPVPAGTATVTARFTRCSALTLKLVQSGVTLASKTGASPLVASARVSAGTLTAIASGSCASSATLSVATAPTATATPTATAGSWLSGASGDGAANGAYGTWRGTPITIGGTWNDSLDAQTNEWTLLPGAEWGAWNGALDVAVGAIYKANGESWAKAAAGAYDARWTTALNRIKTAWGARTGRLYLRFAHEFNGDWAPWSVSAGEAGDFRTAWGRFRSLQRQILPAAALVFCPNDGTSASLGLDWRVAFPGTTLVDVLAVDSYNQYPWVNTTNDFTAKINALDGFGAPVGLERHRQYAQSVGLPFAISEWSTDADMGDADQFVHLFHSWVAGHAGAGAGQVLYEIHFNVGAYGTGQFQFYPVTRQPRAAAAYIQDF